MSPATSSKSRSFFAFLCAGALFAPAAFADDVVHADTLLQPTAAQRFRHFVPLESERALPVVRLTAMQLADSSEWSGDSVDFGADDHSVSEDPLADAPAPDVDAPASSSRGVDPNFAKRQQAADEKLKAEREPASTTHSLTKDYPDDYIVVCEAGCRGDADAIVSRVPKPSRTRIDAARLDPTASQSNAPLDGEEPGDTQAVTAPGPQSDDIQCVAGCYGSVSKSHPVRRPRRADLGSKATTAHLIVERQAAYNGAIVGPRVAVVVAAAMDD